MNELITTAIEFIDAAPAWVNALTAAFVGLKALTMLTPTKADNVILDKILKVLNFLALNILKDKNADSE